MKRLNCWELKSCGRGPGGTKAAELGACPAATDAELNGINGGANGGRVCWAVAGTLCGGMVQGEFAQKHLACMDCNVMHRIREEMGSKFILMPDSQHVEGAFRAGEAIMRAHERIRELVAQLEARNEFIRQVFGRYLSDEVVASLLETPEGLALGGESREVTVMMADLRGFSPLAENLPPAEVIKLLNHYLGTMAETVAKHGGTVDEFIGDAILAVFGAPIRRDGHARLAVACAVEMQLCMPEVNRFNATMGLPQVEMGIGLNTGEVIVGNIGSERRSKFGVVGRHVNLASRIEAYTIGGQILISEATATAAGEGLRIDSELEVFPKGSTRPMRLYDLGGIGAEYGLALPKRRTDLRELAQPVRILFSVLDGKNIPAPDFEATITHLSSKEARISCARPVDPMAVVKFDFPTAKSGAVHVYGKVLSAGDSGREVLLHFTSVGVGAADAIALLMRTTVQPTGGSAP
ncbi:MAG: adenylate/guanylate cyclase domain-containing protein [Candidatus Wallbacteria bacterium]|nr:adenylate/guanylate cyclase domain-containing protein [Candidatus Wallbacteria bacterium]